MRLIIALAIALYVAGVFWAHAGASTPVYPTAEYLSGCVAIAPSGEGFPRIYCPEDGATLYQDMDGQIYENAAGNPVYAPGTWVEEVS